ILNVTPDSFSDGGCFNTVDAAVARGRWLVAHGADMVDVGGESTRPGAARIDEHEELRRVLPVITELSAAGIAVSIDTMRARVAAAAIEAGAVLVNDVSGGLADPAMLPLVAEAQVPCILMHWRGHSTTMDQLAVYTDVVEDVRVELSSRVDAALNAGVRLDRIVLDPGLGFAKDNAHNWQLLGGLARLRSLGLPVLVGASRKRFLADVVTYDGAEVTRPSGRDDASSAVAALAAAQGVWGVRVHEPSAAAAAVRVAESVRRQTLRPVGEP
ncbi:MAG: dihydropteroate synthase, partial [Marmoricola sp.]